MSSHFADFWSESKIKPKEQNGYTEVNAHNEQISIGSTMPALPPTVPDYSNQLRSQ
ncbi:polyketide synthase [Aspergillus luchuensis]|uniref:Polyketide synthase n=1 Tax=Aspergillus kawachii TaxID=1069201 RepID=A0A146EYI7_ASPKA|nr:polyketide synthase [Aspergillus luchuensis]